MGLQDMNKELKEEIEDLFRSFDDRSTRTVLSILDEILALSYPMGDRAYIREF